jgi:hypothetical protein
MRCFFFHTVLLISKKFYGDMYNHRVGTCSGSPRIITFPFEDEYKRGAPAGLCGGPPRPIKLYVDSMLNTGSCLQPYRSPIT